MSMFDKYIPLFGRKNDQRVGYFLKVLFQHATEARKKRGADDIIPNDLIMNPVPTGFQNQYFISPEGTMAPDAVHPEITTLLVDIDIRNKGPVVDARMVDSLLNTPVSNGSFEQFMQILVLQMVDISSGNINNNWVRNILGSGSILTEFNALSGSSYSADSNQRILNVNIGKFLHKLQTSILSSPASKILTETRLPSEDQYYRNEKGELLMRVEAGEPIKMDQKYLNSRTDKCYGTNVDADTKNVRCQEYLLDCLGGKGESISKCKAFLIDPNFWKESKKEVEEMHPEIAVSTLRALQFEAETIKDEATNTNIKRFRGVPSWLESLKKLIADADRSGNVPEGKLLRSEHLKIVTNAPLKKYLDLIVAKVNNNPAILNPGYRVSAKDYCKGANFQGSRFHKMGVPALLVGDNVCSEVEKFALNVKDNSRAVGISIGVMPSARLMVPIMAGGGAIATRIEQLRSKGNNNSQSAAMFKRMYDSLVQRLSKLDKTVSDADNQEIKKIIDRLADAENKLYKTMEVTDRYIDLITLYKEQDTDNVLSIDNLEKFVEARKNYFNKTTKRQNDLIGVFRSISQQISDATTKLQLLQPQQVQQVQQPQPVDNKTTIDYKQLFKSFA